VSDFSWNANAIRTVASVSDDNILQIWQIADNIFMEGVNGDNDDAEDAPADEDLE
jgi:histone-binding protein RBBP4